MSYTYRRFCFRILASVSRSAQEGVNPFSKVMDSSQVSEQAGGKPDGYDKVIDLVVKAGVRAKYGRPMQMQICFCRQ